MSVSNTPGNTTETIDHKNYLARDLTILFGVLGAVAVIYSVAFFTTGTQQIESQPPVSGVFSRIDEAASDIEQLVRIGDRLMDTGKYIEAISHYDRVLLLDSTLVDVRVDRGSCYYASDMFEDALSDFSRAISMKPDHAIAHFNLGITTSLRIFHLIPSLDVAIPISRPFVYHEKYI